MTRYNRTYPVVPRYNHMFMVAVTVETTQPDPHKVSANDLLRAMEARIDDLDPLGEDEIREAFAPVEDSYEVEPA